MEPVQPSVAALSQTRAPAEETAGRRPPRDPDDGRRFVVADRLFWDVPQRPYQRRPGQPVYRPLRVFTLDPSISRMDGAVTELRIPYEELRRLSGPGGEGFAGEAFEVRDPSGGLRQAADLDSIEAMLGGGLAPRPSDPRFHQQMVYAVASLNYTAFRTALGRDLTWGFDRPRLTLRPYAMEENNAYYDPARGEVRFGYARDPDSGVFLFSSLSHDIIVHEVTHALLDGLHSHFRVFSHPDVAAFHEAFSDLVALLLHFSHSELVLAEIRRSRGDLRSAAPLRNLAGEFAKTFGMEEALRMAVDLHDSGCAETLVLSDDLDEPHDRGVVLVRAVFDVFLTLFERKTRRYLLLAGIDPTADHQMGSLPRDLQEVLAEKASTLASQLLTILIRSVDYLPPVDLRLGEVLRAVVTADRDLVPDDPWAYREAWTRAFARRKIPVEGLSILDERSLVWECPDSALVCEGLSFSRLRFDTGPSYPSSLEERYRQACEVGRLVTERGREGAFGLAPSGTPSLDGDRVDLPRVESVRSAQRVGPDGQVSFDLVAEVVQRRWIRTENGLRMPFYGGATLVFGPQGEVRYVVRKRIDHEDRLEAQRRAVVGGPLSPFWHEEGGALHPREGSSLHLLHQHARGAR